VLYSFQKFLNSSSLIFLIMSSVLRTSFFFITFSSLCCCSVSRDTFSGRSSESTYTCSDMQHSRTSPMSSNELLKQLNWLLTEWRIRFKHATMTFKALYTDRPPYLSDLLQHHEPKRSLRSSSSHQLLVPRHKLTFGSRAVRFSAPRVWNSLPISIRETKSLPTFRRHLKTLYFQSAHPLSAFHLA